MLTVKEAAGLTRQSERSVRRKIRTGQIPAIRLGEGAAAPLRIPREGLEQWLYGDPPEAA